MTRVLQLVSRDEPGGVQVLTRMIEVGLRDRDIEVTTMVLDPGSTWRARWLHLRALARLLMFGGYDAVLSYQAAAGLYAALFAAIGQVPIRAVHQTAMPDAVRMHWRLLDVCCGAVGLHTAVIANSHATAEAFVRYPSAYRQRLHVIAHGVTPLPQPKFPLDWRSKLGIPSLAPLLVSTGRLAAQKNHALAVAALGNLPGAHLVIAGDGVERPALLAQATAGGVAERLHLVGDLPRDGVAGLLAAADIYVFPSVWETFGLAVVEAGMAGLPIVAADLPVLSEVLEPALGYGMVRFHHADDAASLASSVRAMLAQSPDAARRAASAQAMARHHGVATMLDAYELLLGSLARASR